MSKKQLTELQQEAYNLEMANRRLRVQIEGLEGAVKNYRENCRMAIVKAIRLEDEIETKNRLIDHLTEERNGLLAELHKANGIIIDLQRNPPKPTSSDRGLCKHCLGMVYPDDDYKLVNGQLYHLKCNELNTKTGE